MRLPALLADLRLLLALPLISATFATNAIPQACTQTCSCTLGSAAQSFLPEPGCLGTLTYTITGVSNGCCNTISGCSTSANCQYSMTITGTSDDDPGCCFQVILAGVPPLVQGVSPALNFGPFNATLGCATADNWSVNVGAAGTGGQPCAGVTGSTVLAIVVTCNNC
jgi:hypothetical protein